MTKIRALLKSRHRIIEDIVIEKERPHVHDEWQDALGELCDRLSLSRPILLSKHIHELENFSRTSFLADDFMEEINFYKMEIEVFSES